MTGRHLLCGGLALLLAGCQVWVAPVVAPVAVVTPGAPPEVVVTQLPVLECSVLHFFVLRGYCRPIEQPPPPPAYCTRGLAKVDCWDRPNPYGYYQREVADGPMRLTPEQEWNRTGRWPTAVPRAD